MYSNIFPFISVFIIYRLISVMQQCTILKTQMINVKVEALIDV